MAARLVLTLVVVALGASACGGGGDEAGGTAEEQQATRPAETGRTETTEGSAVGADAEAGEQVFASAGCGGCHALEEAGSTGGTGPELDAGNYSAAQVEEQVRKGGNGMPAFEDQLSDEEIANVTAFVVEASKS